MKRLATLLAVALAAALFGFSRTNADEPKTEKGRVLLVSFDAFRPEVYRDERFHMPNLRKLAERGIQAKKVVGVFPTLTYPSHTSIATGCRPARHGIVANTVFDPLDGGKRWYWEATHIKARTIWDAAHRGGLKTSAVRWPVTVGANIDFHLPEAFGAAENDDHWAIFKKAATPGLVEKLGIELPENPFDEPGTDAVFTKAAAKILEDEKPELLMIHLVQADGAQHHSGRDADDVVKAFEKLDEHLGTLLAALDKAGTLEQTNVIVTGDHGFMDVHTLVRPNALLREAGLVTLDADKKPKEWTALCQGTGGSAPIYLREPADKAMAAKVLELFKSAAASKYRGIFNVLDRDALDREEAFPGAIGAIECEPGYSCDFTIDGPVLHAATIRGTHGYLPTREELATGLVAAGPGLARGRILPSFRQIDIAPLVARLLGVDLGPGVEGVVVPGALARP